MNILRSSLRLVAAALLAALLAGCQTDSTGAPGPVAQAAPSQIPRHEAALECWQSVEKGRKDLPLDTRADIVTRCVDEKMQAAQAVPEATETSATVALPQPLPWQHRTKT